MNTTTASALITTTAATFAVDVLAASQSQPVLVDFWAAWCGPCKMIAPALAEIAQEQAGVVRIAKVDVDSEPDLAAQYQVRALPTLLIFHRGKVVDTLVGAQPKAVLVSRLAAVAGASR